MLQQDREYFELITGLEVFPNQLVEMYNRHLVAWHKLNSGPIGLLHCITIVELTKTQFAESTPVKDIVDWQGVERNTKVVVQVKDEEEKVGNFVSYLSGGLLGITYPNDPTGYVHEIAAGFVRLFDEFRDATLEPELVETPKEDIWTGGIPELGGPFPGGKRNWAKVKEGEKVEISAKNESGFVEGVFVSAKDDTLCVEYKGKRGDVPHNLVRLPKKESD